MGFFERIRGYNDGVAREFTLSLIPLTRSSATVVVKGLSVTITPEVISIINTPPLGLQWRKEDKQHPCKEKFLFARRIANSRQKWG